MAIVVPRPMPRKHLKLPLENRDAEKPMPPMPSLAEPLQELKRVRLVPGKRQSIAIIPKVERAIAPSVLQSPFNKR
jgi:hypothetical protein